MNLPAEKVKTQVPQLDLSDGAEMLNDFSREAQRHLISARNSLLVLETLPSDKEAIDNIFKTFHTIKGLSDFLDLRDICNLTGAAEDLIDAVRKYTLLWDDRVNQLTRQAINNLQKLLELLDEQIANAGLLKSSYLDVGDLIYLIQNKIYHEAKAAPIKKEVKLLPTIKFEPDMTVFSEIEAKVSQGNEEVTLQSATVRKLLDDFQILCQEMKEIQSKLHERQRELIKERELAVKLTQQAQSEARTKSEFLANMSHEIRTLINAILGFTDVLKEGNLSSKQKEHVNTIIMSGKMMLGIVNDILDFSKVEAGKLKLETIDFYIHNIIDEVFKIIRTRLLGKAICLHFSIAKETPAVLIGDPTRLKQIFINLLDNAIKFTESGEIGLHVNLDQKQNANVGKFPLEIIVYDTGMGIPEDRRERIFESFTQADVSTTRVHGGTGLGLTLVKTFVETMGGKIRVESQMGKGSKFLFS